MTTSKLTRHELYFRPRVVWTLTFAFLGVLLAARLSLWALLASAAIAIVQVTSNVGARWKQALRQGRRVPPVRSPPAVARQREPIP